MNLLKKLFGGGRKSGAEGVLEETLESIIEKSGLDLSFDMKVSKDNKEVLLDVFGQDEELLKDKDGALLDAMQLFLKRVLQNKAPDDRINLIVDSGTYREDADEELLVLAEKIKGIALKKKKAVYFRALPPRERKIVHQYLAEDKKVKSKSVGDGLFKKIKVFPVGMKPKKSGPNPNHSNSNNNSNKNKNGNNKNGNSNHNKSAAPKTDAEVNGNTHNTAPAVDEASEQNFNR